MRMRREFWKEFWTLEDILIQVFYVYSVSFVLEWLYDWKRNKQNEMWMQHAVVIWVSMYLENCVNGITCKAYLQLHFMTFSFHFVVSFRSFYNICVNCRKWTRLIFTAWKQCGKWPASVTHTFIQSHSVIYSLLITLSDKDFVLNRLNNGDEFAVSVIYHFIKCTLYDHSTNEHCHL
jgi:hypothetical protein